ncbi:MAG TPA: aminotransferase class V-fold PLP-dependent enzyme [Patescibacteria group bacterium]|nr:aminotransferase class V-fold PLP-dependent enzyme [Patescibacteria group bacterium]
MIYLDNAATTWPKPECVYAAVDYCLRNIAANPGRGGHRMAREAGLLLFETRELLAQLLGVEDPNRICFTYNATDSLNIALLGLLKEGDVVLTTSLEHNAVARPLRWLERNRGIRLKIIGGDDQGRLRLDVLQKELEQGAAAVVMTHASNVTGALMPVAEVGRLTRRQGTQLIVDAAQTAGVEPIDVEAMGIDVLAFSGHKGLLGPQGTGGIYVREGLVIQPLRTGGTGSLSESDRQPDFMPDSLESGTPNTPGIAGLRAALQYIHEQGREVLQERERLLARQLINGFAEIPGVRLLGPAAEEERTAVVSVTVRNWDSGALARELDEQYGIACRGGLHCAPWAHEAMGTLKTGAVRFSPGAFTSTEEIEQAVRAMEKLCEKGQSL